MMMRVSLNELNLKQVKEAELVEWKARSQRIERVPNGRNKIGWKEKSTETVLKSLESLDFPPKKSNKRERERIRMRKEVKKMNSSNVIVWKDHANSECEEESWKQLLWQFRCLCKKANESEWTEQWKREMVGGRKRVGGKTRVLQFHQKFPTPIIIRVFGLLVRSMRRFLLFFLIFFFIFFYFFLLLLKMFLWWLDESAPWIVGSQKEEKRWKRTRSRMKPANKRFAVWFSWLLNE